ncbi:unnamed protein product, partial [Brenthis ino]
MVVGLAKPALSYMRVCAEHFTEFDFFKAYNGAVKIPRLKRTAIPSKKLPETKHDIKVSIVEDSCPSQHSEQTLENDLTDIVNTIPRLKENAIRNTKYLEKKQDNEVHFVEDSRLNQHPDHSHENDLSNKAKTVPRLKQNSPLSKKQPEKKHEVMIVQNSSQTPSGHARLNDLSNVARKLALGVGLLSSFKWLNEPSEWCFENNILTLKTENETDFWQGTWYNSFVNTGHVYGVELQDDFTLEVCVEAKFESLNDQAGLMLYVDEKHWLKAGIEYNKDQPMIGSILTNEVSDWATGVFQGDPSKFWLRLTKLGNVVCVKYSTDNICWNSLRLSTFPICDKYFVGPMSCTPQRGGLIVRFSHLTFTVV